MPDSPNLLFTNAGMNQFVPIFLGQKKADVSKWAGAVPGSDTRAADTQKCIRAGGKHNDLDDVGLDTYHHTFFEMLGNWSFGDYFKKEAIEWAWELVVDVWKFPPQRLYATVYSPDKSLNDPSEFDQEAWNHWADKFRSVGLDPKIHIVNGGKKDNFWMMGETGPCGPCSEIHVDLTPDGKTEGKLVNQGDARCMEIWNLVFIQFNANPDGTFSPLPARHVDTGMGFERVTSIIQGTKGLKDFARAKISNYQTDIFRPIFDALEKLSGKKYGSTLPGEHTRPRVSEDAPPRPSRVTETSAMARSNSVDEASTEAREGACAPLKTSGELPCGEIEVTGPSAHAGPVGDDDDDGTSNNPSPAASQEQIALDVAFRVIADHIRTLSFAIADGIQPSNEGRGYVLRRILRRAVRYGRTLGFHEPFFYKLVDVLVETMGGVFPEIRAKKKHVQDIIRVEEEAFNKTLDRGIELFTEEAGSARHISGAFAFRLYDEQGFPLDLTELMARERGLTVDKEGFEKLMEEQRERGRAAQKKEIISVSQIETTTPTQFVGYEKLAINAKVLEVVALKDKTAVVLDVSPFYAEMGGQVGDTGQIEKGAQFWRVTNTQKSGNTWLHILEGQHTRPRVSEDAPPRPSRVTETAEPGSKPGLSSAVARSTAVDEASTAAPEAGALPMHGNIVTLSVDKSRRNAIQRHHTVTHLLHWALHEVVSPEATQKGSFVGPEKLTFDFNSAPLTIQQVADIEKLVNERILENAGVSWTEVPYADVKSRRDVMQFFGDKYGDVVRVVQIGGQSSKLDGYSMELCGGTHTRATGEIGLFRIVGESAIAAGVRRIEAVAGLEAYSKANEELRLIESLAGRVNSPVHELEKKIESLLEHQKTLEKSLRTATMREASNVASNLLEQSHIVNGILAIIHNIGGVDGDFLQAVADSLKGRFKGVIILGGAVSGAVSLVAAVSSDLTSRVQAGKIIQQIAPIVGGKGGGRPDNARGGGKEAGKLDEALAKAKSLLA